MMQRFTQADGRTIYINIAQVRTVEPYGGTGGDFTLVRFEKDHSAVVKGEVSAVAAQLN